MLAIADMRKLARAYLDDAKVLLAGQRHDGAVYLCGYAVELRFKVRICQTLKWQGYPESRKEFEGLQSFKTHDLELLLHLGGREQLVMSAYSKEWYIVAQ